MLALLSCNCYMKENDEKQGKKANKNFPVYKLNRSLLALSKTIVDKLSETCSEIRSNFLLQLDLLQVSLLIYKQMGGKKKKKRERKREGERDL